MKKLYQGAKIDMGLKPVSLASTNQTGDYFSMKNFRKALFILEVADIAATYTTLLEILQGTSAVPGASKAVASATATIAANTLVSEFTIALAAVGTGDIVTINGVAFTKGSTDASARTFADAAGLVTCINSVLYGVPGAFASAQSTTVTVKASDRGATSFTVTCTNVGGTITLATTKALAYVEVDAGTLDDANGYCWVAAKVTTDSTQVVSVTLIRGEPRNLPVQKVAANAAV